MAVITISRGSYSGGRDVAVKLAEKLGYQCVAREALLEASAQFNSPEARLVRAVHDAPSFLGRFAYGKEKYIAYIQAALVRHVRQDKVVYHGLAGHLLLHGVAHVIKVRITADHERRIAIVMERDKVGRPEAERILKNDDAERRAWTMSLYGADPTDSSLYDVVLHVGRMTVDEAADILASVARLPSFATTPASQKAMDDLGLAAEVRCRLVELMPNARVHADQGKVTVETTTAAVPLASLREQMTAEIRALAASVPGVQEVRVVESEPNPYMSGD